MSASEPAQVDGTEGGINLDERGLVNPTLSQGGIKVEPASVEKIEGSTSGNAAYHTDMCGHTEMDKVGNTEWHLTLEGICTKTQLSNLKKMNPAEGDVKLVSEGHVGIVEFDKFTWTQESDHQRATFFLNGEEVTEPIFTFHIQSRDDESQ